MNKTQWVFAHGAWDTIRLNITAFIDCTDREFTCTNQYSKHQVPSKSNTLARKCMDRSLYASRKILFCTKSTVHPAFLICFVFTNNTNRTKTVEQDRERSPVTSATQIKKKKTNPEALVRGQRSDHTGKTCCLGGGAGGGRRGGGREKALVVMHVKPEQSNQSVPCMQSWQHDQNRGANGPTFDTQDGGIPI